MHSNYSSYFVKQLYFEKYENAVEMWIFTHFID